MEMLAVGTMDWIKQRQTPYGIFETWYDPYFVYGSAAVGMILLYNLLPKRWTRRLSVHFVLNAVLCSVMEYITGVWIIHTTGMRYWDYSLKPLNLHGHIWLGNTLAFALVGTAFSYFLYPWVERGMGKFWTRLAKKRQTKKN